MNKLNSPQIICPIKSAADLQTLIETQCTNVYIPAMYFYTDSTYEVLSVVIDLANKQNFNLFVYFDNKITDQSTDSIQKLLNMLQKQNITGLIVNSYGILKLIEDKNLDFNLYIDSGLNVHNLASVDFIQNNQKVKSINITEEIYTQNITKIKKITKKSLIANSDNLPWIAEELLNNNVLDYVIIKGDFKSSKELVSGINYLEKILNNSAPIKKKKLPFKNSDNFYYESNHFLGEFRSARGKSFKFSENIVSHKWEPLKIKLKDKALKEKHYPYSVTLRINSLEHIKYLKKYIKGLKYNPISAIEYGEIISTSDLKKLSFNKILQKVKTECHNMNLSLQLSTPRILIERDFDRVFEYVKELCLEEPFPATLIANNSGYWWTVANDTDLNEIKLELGQGLNLKDSESIKYLAEKASTNSVDLSNIQDFESLKLCIKEIKNIIPIKKYTIGGNIRIPSLGLCPLNRDYAILSRLSCAAPCHNGHFAIKDPEFLNTFPFTVDGFCRMHIFKDKILDLFNYSKELKSIGINEFVIDFSSLPPEFIPIMLTKYLNSLSNAEDNHSENFQEAFE